MRVFKRHPTHRIRAQPEAFLQDAPDPHAGGLAIGAHPDALAGQIGGGFDTPSRAAEHRRFLKAFRHHQRQQHQIAPGGFRHQKGRYRHFADIKTPFAHHGRESLADGLHHLHRQG